MVFDLLLQVGLVLVTVFMFLVMYGIPQKAIAKLRLRSNQGNIQAKRHFVQGAQLLARARSSKDSSSIAKDAVDEADKSLSLDPKDAASHILKALALDLQGYSTSALDSLDAALSPLAVKSLSDPERGDALLKRAELKISVSGSGRVDSALADLVEAQRLISSDNNAKAFCLLGECYEMKDMREEAMKAYEEAIGVEPRSALARKSLNRLASQS